MRNKKPPLYRKVNTTTYGVWRNPYGRAPAYSEMRHSKKQINSEETRQVMRSYQRGRDYTPLFRFLLAKVGQSWSAVYSEAVSRLDKTEPIFWLVALHEHEQVPYVRIGEATYYSGLYVDAEGLLQVVDPSIEPSTLAPKCVCCTHTFNGIPFTRPYVSLWSGNVALGGDQSVRLYLK